MNSTGSRNNSARSGRQTPNSRSRFSPKDGIRSHSGGNASAKQNSRISSTYRSNSGTPRGRPASVSGVLHQQRSNSGSYGIREKSSVRRSGSNNSTKYSDNFNRGNRRSVSAQSFNEQKNNFNGTNSRFSDHSRRIPNEELLSLLLRKTHLSDMRPDMYRLDLTQKDDIRFLYETQHRVDPELVPITKHIDHAKWKKMHESHIFNLSSPSTPRVPSTPIKRNSDGLGALARFIMSSEERTTSPARGRGHRNCTASGTTLWLFSGNENNSRTVSPTPRRTGTRQVSTHPADKLGKDLLSREPLSAEIQPRHGIRTIKSVQAFEATQPKLVLPPRKQSSRTTSAMRSHSASSDNDIFGVRGRRELMNQKVNRSHSARSSHSNDPYGLEEGDGVGEPINLPNEVLNKNELNSYNASEKRSTAPFGEEESNRNGTPTRRHINNRARSPIVKSNGVAPSYTSGNFNHILSPRRCLSSKGDYTKSFAPERYPSSPGVTAAGTTSLNFEEEQEILTPLLSPRLKVGRARVPGHSVNASNIIFGEARTTVSPRRIPPNYQLDSVQMRNILSWD